MIVDATEAIALLDRLSLLQSTIAPEGGYCPRGEWAEPESNDLWNRYRLNGQYAAVPEDYPSPEQVATEPQDIGRRLAIAAAERHLDTVPFDRLAIGGWKFLRASALIIHCQTLRTHLETELATTSKVSPKRTDGKRPKIEKALIEHAEPADISLRFDVTDRYIRQIRADLVADGRLPAG